MKSPLIRRFHLRLIMFMPFGHGVRAFLAQISAYGPTAWVSRGHSFLGTGPEGARQTRYLAPSGPHIRLIGLRTLGAAQGFVGPPLRGLRVCVTTLNPAGGARFECGPPRRAAAFPAGRDQLAGRVPAGSSQAATTRASSLHESGGEPPHSKAPAAPSGSTFDSSACEP
jgi:hypothetical protein